MAEPARGVDPRSEPEADSTGVDGGGIDLGGAHERLQAGLLRRRQPAEPLDRKRPVLVHQRHDVGDRRDRDDVGMRTERLGIAPEQGLAELVHDARAAQLREGVVRRPCGNDWTCGEPVGRTVMIGDDDLKAEPLGLLDRLDGGDPAVDREEEPVALLGEAPHRLDLHAVALVEAAREMPGRVGAQLAEDEQRRARSRRFRRRRSRRARRCAFRLRRPRGCARRPRPRRRAGTDRGRDRRRRGTNARSPGSP